MKWISGVLTCELAWVALHFEVLVTFRFTRLSVRRFLLSYKEKINDSRGPNYVRIEYALEILSLTPSNNRRITVFFGILFKYPNRASTSRGI